MMKLKRQEEIARLLETQGSVQVADLSKQFNVTEKTIRQDLRRLEELAIATRVHGGAVVNGKGSGIFPVFARKQHSLPEKERIAYKALELIEDGDTIILDAGTTTQKLAAILDKSVTVLTNDLVIANDLMDKPEITLLVTGGILKRAKGSSALIGQDALHMLGKYHVDKYFLGASAIDFQNGLMLFTTDEVDLKRAMLRAASQVICLADSTKFRKRALISFAQLNEVNCIVTDEVFPSEDLEFLKAQGIHVVVASPSLTHPRA